MMNANSSGLGIVIAAAAAHWKPHLSAMIPRRTSLPLFCFISLIAGGLGACAKPVESLSPPQIALPLLEADPSTGPFNHSAEVTLAVDGTRVAAAFINLHFDDATSFDGVSSFHKKVGLAVSEDRGTSFQAIDPGFGDQTTDPVLGESADGSLWLLTWDTSRFDPFVRRLMRSKDGGKTWSLVSALPGGDKPWMTIDDARGVVWGGDDQGMWRIAFDGTLERSSDWSALDVPGWPVDLLPTLKGQSLLADDRGAWFLGLQYGDPALATEQLLVFWDGETPPRNLARIGGAFGDYLSADFGLTSEGLFWLLRTEIDSSGHLGVALQLGNDASSLDTRVALTPATGVAFGPASDLDDAGRLHVIYYDTTGPKGELRYTRSRSARFEEGFLDPIVIDPEACPGDGWSPGGGSASGGRRLREYLDLVIEGKRAWIAWTHAPSAPSRVTLSWIEID